MLVRWAGAAAIFVAEEQRRGDVVETSERKPWTFLLFSAPLRLCGENKRAFQQSGGASLPPPLPRARCHTQASRSPDCPDFRSESAFIFEGSYGVNYWHWLPRRPLGGRSLRVVSKASVAQRFRSSPAGSRPALDETDPVSWPSAGLDTGISLATHDFASNQAVSSRDRRGDAGVGD